MKDVKEKEVQNLKKHFSAGKMTRREFIVAATALGLSMTGAMRLADRAYAAMPKSGGHYIQALTGGSTSDSMDPAQTLDSYMINVSFGQLRNNLTEIAPSGKLIGGLAERWEASADAATWTFKLRKGVEFHNGKSRVEPYNLMAAARIDIRGRPYT